MRVIMTDNFDRENVSDSIVAENLNEFYAELIAKLLNGKGDDYTQEYYKAVADDYKLYQFEP